MKAFAFGLLSAMILSTIGLLWGYSEDITILKVWKEEHSKRDTEIFEEIRGELRYLRDGQDSIKHYMIRREK